MAQLSANLIVVAVGAVRLYVRNGTESGPSDGLPPAIVATCQCNLLERVVTLLIIGEDTSVDLL